MKSGIKDILQGKYKLSKESLTPLLEQLEKISIHKKELLLTEGQMDHYVYFVEKGIIKSVILREGREFIIFFALETEMPLSSPNLTSIQHSDYTLEAVEDCILWRIPRKDLASLFEQSLELANWGRVLVEEWFTESCSYFTSMYWMSKREQYLYILEKTPKLAQRLSLKDLAAWLDITPQSLSRIRAGLD